MRWLSSDFRSQFFSELRTFYQSANFGTFRGSIGSDLVVIIDERASFSMRLVYYLANLLDRHLCGKDLNTDHEDEAKKLLIRLADVKGIAKENVSGELTSYQRKLNCLAAISFAPRLKLPSIRTIARVLQANHFASNLLEMSSSTASAERNWKFHKR